jgi:hypothetical protein
VKGGTTFTLECQPPRGSPDPTIWWEKNGKPLEIINSSNSDSPFYILTDPNGNAKSILYSFKNGTLLISNATINDNGEYVCAATNTGGIIRRTRPAFVNVFEPPSFTVRPITSKYEVSSSGIELKCQATGFPQPQIEWKKDNSYDLIPMKAKIQNNNLILPDVEASDEGEYSCVASNHLETIEAKAYVIIYERPQFLKKMPNVTVGIESKSLTIECNAKGRPQPIIYWAKSGHMPSDDAPPNSPTSNPNINDDFIILENGNLFIEHLTKKYEGTYLCQASNEHGRVEMRTELEVKSIEIKPPPIIVYGPQNQTIPINTQAVLECLTSSAFETSKTTTTITWFKGNKQIGIDLYDASKYKLQPTGSLEINNVKTSDSGLYRCVASNSDIKLQTTSRPGYLVVENPNNQYIQFQRNQEPTALPSAPTQPIVTSIGKRELQLTWQPSSHSGHSPIRSYSIEYYSPEWSKQSAGWLILANDIYSTNFKILNNNLLKPDTYYMFIVRARNDQGYGAPSQVSDIVKTFFEPDTIFNTLKDDEITSNDYNFHQKSNQLLEKALSGQIIEIVEPALAITSTSIEIRWKILKSAFLIEGFLIKYKATGNEQSNYKIENIKSINKEINSFLLKNLNKFTTYEISIVPYSGIVQGTESKIVQVKTLEDLPTHYPLNLDVNMESETSMSIKWQPPPFHHTNGIITGYKIICKATNDTRHSLNLKTNSTTRAIIVGNLLQDLTYCIKVAAYNNKGLGPFTDSQCIAMTLETLHQLKGDQTYQIIDSTKRINGEIMFINEPWFIVLIVLASGVVICCLFYCIWWTILKYHRLSMNRKFLAPSSSSSDNNSTVGTHNNIDHRYKLVSNDPATIWLDSMTTNGINQHQQMIKLGGATNHSHKSKINNGCLITSTISTDSTSSGSNGNHMDGNNQPQYAEIYGPPSYLNNNNSVDVYASCGLFNQVDQSSSPNPYNMINYQSGGGGGTFLNSTVMSPNNLKYSSYTIKMINSDSNKPAANLVIDGETMANLSGANGSVEQKKLLKYLQQATATAAAAAAAAAAANQQSTSTSTSNTPRVNSKYLHTNHNPLRCSHKTLQHHHSSHLNHQNQSYSHFNHLNSNHHSFMSTNGHQIHQQQQQQMMNFVDSNHQIEDKQIPQLPLAPPPSLATALLSNQTGSKSPVHYNLPWNGNLETISSTATTTTTSSASNSSSSSSSTFSSNGRTSFSKNNSNQLSKTPSMRQYPKNKIEQQQQQDYSCISPEEEEDFSDELRIAFQQQRNQNNNSSNNGIPPKQHSSGSKSTTSSTCFDDQELEQYQHQQDETHNSAITKNKKYNSNRFDLLDRNNKTVKESSIINNNNLYISEMVS